MSTDKRTHFDVGLSYSKDTIKGAATNVFSTIDFFPHVNIAFKRKQEFGDIYKFIYEFEV